MLERYRACMVLSGVLDAIGFKNGKWEFNKDGPSIIKEYYALGGISEIVVNKKNWKVSDDTVMHLATAESLVESNEEKVESIAQLLSTYYLQCGSDMEGNMIGISGYIKIL